MSQRDLVAIAHRGLALAPSPLMRYMPGGRFAVCEGVALWSWSIPGPSFNKAALLGPTPPLERVLQLAREFFGDSEGGFGLLFEAEAQHPVEAEVLGRGWRVVEDEPALVMPTLPAAPPRPEGLAVRRLREPAELATFLETATAGFGMAPGSLDNMKPDASCIHDPLIAYFVGTWEGRPVTVAQYCSVEGIAVIAGVATLPAFRRRGFGQAITWAAIEEAAARGCTAATLNAGDMSYPLYVQMGFIPVCKHRTYAQPVVT
jgi:ribosomal protein S18 acetylase RimI-like enzyme